MRDENSPLVAPKLLSFPLDTMYFTTIVTFSMYNRL
jgi:hypothetical protein